jgi:hypothetical protein
MKKFLLLSLGISLLGFGTLFAYNQELIGAYNYAYNVGITTMPTIEQANMDGKLIRAHMAKMMSNYATEVLNLVPNTGTNCTFDDVATQSNEIQ